MCNWLVVYEETAYCPLLYIFNLTTTSHVGWAFICVHLCCPTFHYRWRGRPQTWVSSRRPEPGSSSPSSPAAPHTCRSPSLDCCSESRTSQEGQSRRTTQLRDRERRGGRTYKKYIIVIKCPQSVSNILYIVQHHYIKEKKLDEIHLLDQKEIVCEISILNIHFSRLVSDATASLWTNFVVRPGLLLDVHVSHPSFTVQISNSKELCHNWKPKSWVWSPAMLLCGKCMQKISSSLKWFDRGITARWAAEISSPDRREEKEEQWRQEEKTKEREDENSLFSGVETFECSPSSNWRL